MIGRLVGYGVAVVFTGTVVAGAGALIAADMFGTDSVGKAWAAATTPRPPSAVSGELERAKNINFFIDAPVAGRSLKVTTGTSFASAADFEARKVMARWCYIQVGGSGGVARKITLAEQDGEKPPVYFDASKLSDDELQPFGLSAREAARLARSHCRFGAYGSGAGLEARKADLP